MSWGQWPGGGAPQPGLITSAVNPAPTVVNPGSIATPGLPYTAEQWAQMQQQNWQQWAQWQQQFQQWQQQYGAQYAKSINALASQAPPATLHNFPNTTVPPPLPIDSKPPPPPDDPPVTTIPGPSAPTYPGYTSACTNPSNYVSSAPQQHPPYSMLNQPPPNYQMHMRSGQQVPETSQSSNKHERTGYSGVNNESRLSGQPFHRTNPYNHQVPQNQTANFSKPPSNIVANDSDIRNTFENKRQPESWSQQKDEFTKVMPAPSTSNKVNVEELSEAEKKFDKQFAEWEAQFQKWKEQNANHPDKAQYREYEKKWENWRTQLLERREQMRRKRLGLSGDFKVTQSKPNQLSQVKAETRSQMEPGIIPPNQIVSQTGNVSAQSGIIAQTSNNSNVQASIKPAATPEIYTDKDEKNSILNTKLPIRVEEKMPENDSTPHKDDNSVLFLKPTPSEDIPGLDLVKENNEPDDDKIKNIVNTPDLAAISKGLDTILGDEKFLNMLNMVSKNHSIQPPPVVKSTPGTLDSFPQIQKKGREDLRYEENKMGKLDYNFKGNDAVNDMAEPFEPRNHQGLPVRDGGFGHFDSQSSLNVKGTNYPQNFRGEPESFKEPSTDFGSRDFGDRNGGFNRNYMGRNSGPAPRMFNSKVDNVRGYQDPFQTIGNAGQGRIQGEPMPDDMKSFDDNYGYYDRNEPDINFSMQNNSNRIFRPGNFENSNCPPYVTNLSRNNFERNNEFRRNNNKRPFERGPNDFERIPNFDRFGIDRGNFEKPPVGFDQDRRFEDFRNSNRDIRNFGNDSRSMTNRSSNIEADVSNFGRGFNTEAEHFRINREESRDSSEMRKPFGTEHVIFNEGIDNTGLPTRVPTNFEEIEGAQNAFVDNPNFSPNDNFGNKFPTKNEFPTQPIPPDDLDTIWKPDIVTDYDHKSIKQTSDFEVMVVSVHAFDYRHKSLNRIPLPQRPKWLKESVKNYPEFDFIINRPFEPQQLRRYPVNESMRSFDSHDFPYERQKYKESSFDRLSADGKRSYADNRSYDKSLEDIRSYEDKRRSDDRYEKKSNEKRNYDEKPYFDSRSSDRKRNYDERENKHLRFKSNERDEFTKKPYDEERSFTNYDTEFPYSQRKKESSNQNVSTITNSETDQWSLPVDKNSLMQINENVKEVFKSNIASGVMETKNSNLTLIEDLLNPPGRFHRPSRIVIILRGPPGSGKTTLAKLIKDREVENGGSTPRILSLDDYFMVEQEKELIEDGRKVKVKEMVYEYEGCMEASYRQSLMKAFKKTVTDGYFPFIIVDNVNEKVKYFGEMWSFAKQNGFQVYVCQLELDVQTCTKRNVHGRTEADIQKCVAAWEPTPLHHPILDATSLIQTGSIPEVEMEEINSPQSISNYEPQEENIFRSKWDAFDVSHDNLAKLDGISKPLRPSTTMEDYLQFDDEWARNIPTKPGQKRVRWADLEERKNQEKMRAIGFIVGQTNWDRMMDPTMGSSALAQTKFIERFKY